MRVTYVRPPGRTRRFRQELLEDGDDLKVTLLRVGRDGPLEVEGAAVLEPGSSVLWYTFPGRRYEVAAFHDPRGRLLGHYTNVVRPPEIQGHRWRITDLFLDVWQPAGGEPRILDEEELRRALEEGWVGEEDARRARRVCRRVAEKARDGAWPPEEVASRPLDAVPGMRLRRDEPGTWHANRISLRVIAFGMYLLGAASLTSLAFAAATDALTADGPARRWWMAALAVETVVLAVGSAAGQLPATRRVRPREVMDERTLLLGAAVCGVAVLLAHDSALWRTLLSAVYGALSLFLGVFAVCRLRFDDRTPRLALLGLAVCAVALLVLL